MNREYALRARWVVPVDAPRIDGGVVTVVGDRIAAVGKQTHVARVVDLGEVALLPGFVNAHTHLELSDVAAPLGSPGMSLPEWIPRVVAWRRDRAANVNRQRDAVRAGLAESLATGVTTVADIVQTDWPSEEFAASPIRSTALLELIGLSEARAAAVEAAAREHVALAATMPAHCRLGISPHAPYSVRPSVLQSLGDAPVAMHLAESPEELELLADARGPFRAMLEALGAWQEGIFGGKSPMDYLKRLADRSGTAPTLVVHGNYLDADAWKLLAAERARMTVVYCPRTHAYFRHRPYPLREMWAEGVRVAVGTDSRASNPDLSVLAELRQIARVHLDELQQSMPRETALQRILATGTQEGAAALGDGGGAGTISVGKRADLVGVALDANGSAPSDVVENLLLGQGGAAVTIAAGDVVHDPRGLITVALT